MIVVQCKGGVHRLRSPFIKPRPNRLGIADLSGLGAEIVVEPDAILALRPILDQGVVDTSLIIKLKNRKLKGDIFGIAGPQPR